MHACGERAESLSCKSVAQAHLDEVAGGDGSVLPVAGMLDVQTSHLVRRPAQRLHPEPVGPVHHLQAGARTCSEATAAQRRAVIHTHDSG